MINNLLSGTFFRSFRVFVQTNWYLLAENAEHPAEGSKIKYYDYISGVNHYNQRRFHTLCVQRHFLTPRITGVNKSLSLHDLISCHVVLVTVTCEFQMLHSCNRNEAENNKHQTACSCESIWGSLIELIMAPVDKPLTGLGLGPFTGLQLDPSDGHIAINRIVP